MGREVVKIMTSRGCHVTVIGRREPNSQDREIANADFHLVDIQDEAATKKVLSKAISVNGKLNYLVFCHRYRGEEDPWAGEIDVSLYATKYIVEFVSESFEEDGDKSIVFVSSVFGDFVGEGQQVSYHVGKAGLNQLMRFYAVNLGRKGIRVNAITPFTFLKEESKQFYLKNEKLMSLYKDIVPLGRISTSEDNANVVGFLCSPEACFIAGQNIYIDGGLSLVWQETLARMLADV